MVQRALSQALRCTPRHVTALVDALEAQGLVTRGPHPTDRRATLVTPTSQGVAAATRMDAERRQAATALFGEVPPGELAAFTAVADRVLDLLGQASPTPLQAPSPSLATPPPQRRSDGIATLQQRCLYAHSRR